MAEAHILSADISALKEAYDALDFEESLVNDFTNVRHMSTAATENVG